jgi:hypothetical protein
MKQSAGNTLGRHHTERGIIVTRELPPTVPERFDLVTVNFAVDRDIEICARVPTQRPAKDPPAAISESCGGIADNELHEVDGIFELRSASRGEKNFGGAPPAPQRRRKPKNWPGITRRLFDSFLTRCRLDRT